MLKYSDDNDSLDPVRKEVKALCQNTYNSYLLVTIACWSAIYAPKLRFNSIELIV
jgi:hypothetical protein